MNIRFYNARILTMKEEEEIFNGELWVQDEKISFVGKTSEIPQNKILWDREIDCNGNLLMPGFKNAHTHSGMTILRSAADDLPLDKWLNELVFPVESGLTKEDIYEATKLAVLEYLSSGITAVLEMYLTPDSVAEAFEDMGMRCVQTCAINNFSLSVDKMEDYYLNYNNPDSLNSFKLGFHAEYTCSEELLKEISKLAHKYKAPVYTHLSETKSETQGCIERNGMTPLAYLDSFDLFEYGGGVYHCVHITDDDMEIMKKRGLIVVTNPGSNTKLASGIAPISEYLKRNIPVAIGTDGPASNNCLDMFREMFLVTGLAKLKENDAAAVDASEVLKMATVNGAKVMELNSSDVLSEGKYADLIMIDLWQPNMQPIHNIVKNIVYSGSKTNIKMTMINGKILYEDGKYYTSDSPENIYAKVEEIVKKKVTLK